MFGNHQNIQGRWQSFLKQSKDHRHQHRSETETVSGDRNRHQGSVGVCFVGFREARATLALWLG